MAASSPKLLSLSQLREIDPSLRLVSDEDLEIVRSSLYEMAQLAFDVWNEGNGGSKYPVGSFTPEAHGSTL